MNIQKTQSAPKSVLLSLTGWYLMPDSNKDVTLLDPCVYLCCLAFFKPQQNWSVWQPWFDHWKISIRLKADYTT